MINVGMCSPEACVEKVLLKAFENLGTPKDNYYYRFLSSWEDEINDDIEIAWEQKRQDPSLFFQEIHSMKTVGE
jgi:hypothetical protein